MCVCVCACVCVCVWRYEASIVSIIGAGAGIWAIPTTIDVPSCESEVFLGDVWLWEF